jgi:hypothetical protein
MKLVLIATLALTLMACAASSPRIDPARIDALKEGQTTVDEVVRQFGRPGVISRNPDGTQSAIYLYGAEGQSGTTMVPLIATSPADSTTFYFDTKGVLTDYKIKETERAAPAQAAAATPVQSAGAQASSDGTAPGKPATAQTATKKPLPPNVTDRWPGSTTENR